MSKIIKNGRNETHRSFRSDFMDIRKNKWLFTATIMFLFYSILESLDCVILLLIILKIMPNLYLNWLFANPMIQQMLQNYTIYMFLFFIGFTSWRMISTIGLFKNRLWGFWLGLTNLLVTIVLDMWFLPIGAIEIFSCIVIIVILMVGYYDNQQII